MTSREEHIQLQYPTGKFIFDEYATNQSRAVHIKDIERLPEKLKLAVKNLDDEQLDTPYRPGGWTVRQVIHHIPDSHLNAYVRIKLALTEDVPTIKPYDEKEWAKLKDYNLTPVEVSLNLLEAVHKRWVILLNSLEDNDFRKKFNHPETGLISLDYTVAHYAWHGNHHLAHITKLCERMGWK